MGEIRRECRATKRVKKEQARGGQGQEMRAAMTAMVLLTTHGLAAARALVAQDDVGGIGIREMMAMAIPGPSVKGHESGYGNE